MLSFDEARHEYRWAGAPVPNVTRVLAPLSDFSMVNAKVLETARQKGTAVHKMVEFDCRGDLDEDTLPDWMRPVLVQWRKFVSESGFQMLVSEHRVFHPHYKYAGTLDLLGTMKNYACIIDVKRSFAAGPAIGLQLAAYLEAYAAQEKVGKAAKRFALKLTETGPYRLEPYTDSNDFGTFLALLTIHNWKGKHQ